jgi:hypothetical protein
MHILNIYAKGDRFGEETLFVEIIPLKKRKLKYTGSIKFDHSKMLQVGDKPFYD